MRLAVGVWLRDLTRECVEPNPGPCQGDIGAPCCCGMNQCDLVRPKDRTNAHGVAGVGLPFDGKCFCGHQVWRHDDQQTNAGKTINMRPTRAHHDDALAIWCSRAWR